MRKTYHTEPRMLVSLSSAVYQIRDFVQKWSYYTQVFCFFCVVMLCCYDVFVLYVYVGPTPV
jgi:hypothetical protein